MERLQTIRFRKHPGGLRALISTLRMLFFLALCITAISTVASVVSIFWHTRQVYVKSRKLLAKELSITGGAIKRVRDVGLYTFQSRSVLDNILLNQMINNVKIEVPKFWTDLGLVRKTPNNYEPGIECAG